MSFFGTGINFNFAAGGPPPEDVFGGLSFEPASDEMGSDLLAAEGYDGSMETYPGGWFDNYSAAGESSRETTPAPPEGTYCRYVRGENAGTMVRTNADDITLTNAKIYFINQYFYGDSDHTGIAGNQMWLQRFWETGGNGFYGPFDDSGGPNGNPITNGSWTRYSWSLRCDQTDNYYFIIQNRDTDNLNPSRNSAIWIDDVWVKEITTLWTEGTGWFVEYGDWDGANDGAGVGSQVAGGRATCDGSQGGNSDLTKSGILTASTSYDVTFTVSGRTAGSVTCVLGSQAGTARSTNATFNESITANGTSFIFRADADFDGTISAISAIG
jgi:hypothetical protein